MDCLLLLEIYPRKLATYTEVGPVEECLARALDIAGASGAAYVRAPDRIEQILDKPVSERIFVMKIDEKLANAEIDTKL